MSQKNKPQCASVYQTLVYVILANIPLAEVNHMAKTKVCVEGDCIRACIFLIVDYCMARMTKKIDLPNVGKDVEQLKLL